MNSEQPSINTCKAIPKWLIICFAAIAFIGFIDATYLTAMHYLQKPVPCTITGGCDEVLNSPYSNIFGLPTAMFGAGYYLFVFLFTLIYLDTKNIRALKFTSWLTIAGLACSIYFVFLMAFVLHSFCQFCLLSAITSTLLFGIGMLFLKRISASR